MTCVPIPDPAYIEPFHRACDVRTCNVDGFGELSGAPGSSGACTGCARPCAGRSPGERSCACALLASFWDTACSSPCTGLSRAWTPGSSHRPGRSGWRPPSRPVRPRLPRQTSTSKACCPGVQLPPARPGRGSVAADDPGHECEGLARQRQRGCCGTRKDLFIAFRPSPPARHGLSSCQTSDGEGWDAPPGSVLSDHADCGSWH
jgi:hypothetical protein